MVKQLLSGWGNKHGYECIYIYIYIYVYIYIYICIYTHTHTHTYQGYTCYTLIKKFEIKMVRQDEYIITHYIDLQQTCLYKYIMLKFHCYTSKSYI